MAKIIATIQKADGNESVGTMWNETAIFDKDTPVSEVMQWASDRAYNLSSPSVVSWEEKKSLNVTLTPAQEPNAQ